MSEPGSHITQLLAWNPVRVIATLTTRLNRPVPAIPLDLFRASVGMLCSVYFLHCFLQVDEFTAPNGLIDHELSLRQKANQLRSLLDSDFRSSFEDFDPYREFFDSLDYKGKIKGREPVKQVLYLWAKSLFVNYVLAAERLDMAHSVEVRLPFLDHQLFEYASQLPARLLTENGTSKSILRNAMRTYLPKSICDRPKHAFWGPASTHSEGNQLYTFTQDILRSKLAVSIPFFDQHDVIRLLDGMANLDRPSRESLDPVLLMLVSMCLLHEQFNL